jgi:hypothetical protein
MRFAGFQTYGDVLAAFAIDRLLIAQEEESNEVVRCYISFASLANGQRRKGRLT